MIGEGVISMPWILAGLLSAGCLPGVLLGSWVVACHRRRTTRELSSIRQELDASLGEWRESSNSCRRDVERVAQGIAQLESGMLSSEELLRAGRLNRSTRAQALQLLRAGILPDNAAISVGLAKREMRLLAHVSRILANP